MKCWHFGTLAGCAFAGSAMAATVSHAQTAAAIPPNPAISIAYIKPSNPDLMPIYQTLQDRKVLETLQRFLSPLQLPSGRKLTVKFDQCGAPDVPYTPGSGTVALCYEYVESIKQVVPASTATLVQGSVTPEAATVGPVVQDILHQTAIGLFDALQLPVWGRLDDAADRVSAFIMLQFGENVAWNTIVGTAWFLSGIATAPPDFSSVSGVVAQRYYTTLCIAVGAEAHQVVGSAADQGSANGTRSFLNFVGNSAAGDLPSNRAQSCPNEYDSAARAFSVLILPHVDQTLLAQVRQATWVSFGE